MGKFYDENANEYGLSVDENDRWDAIVRRDGSPNLTFFYSVRTTGIYCRPGCPARRPRRENVDFHSTCAEAERAGFRPCKRCRPKEPSLTERRTAAVVKACRFIESAEVEPSLEALAKNSGLSRFHFLRVFKTITGITPKAYAMAHRAQRVRAKLPERSTVTEAMYEAGFTSSGRFYGASEEMLGMTPSAFRAGGKNTAICFAVGECDLGSVLVAATGKGVCAILLGDVAKDLILDLEERFPTANLN